MRTWVEWDRALVDVHRDVRKQGYLYRSIVRTREGWVDNLWINLYWYPKMFSIYV